METNRWVIERAGLINFWYYDEEEFVFSEGRLLLRGSNGSGKSVTMQSFIPLLLDGNKSPDRLDPFGSRARKLENYLLGDEDNKKNENTAYLYMEFKKQQTQNYITIGIGLKAVRNKPLQSWGFSITDGRRIGRDFYLYKDVGEKIPLSKKELENRIGTGGRVAEGQGDYMKMVNDLLFGFDEIDEYDELIKLLVQLRSPKLSKDFKPTVVYEIMENSLQQLSEDDLRPMSEAIENMDNIKSRLEELNDSKKAADRIKPYYDRYNNLIMLNKAKAFVNCTSELDKLQREIDQNAKLRDNADEEYKKAGANVEDLRIMKDTAEEKRKELEKHDSLRIKENIVRLEEDMKNLSGEKENKEKQLEDKKMRNIELRNRLKEYSGSEEAGINNIEYKLKQMDELSEGFAFDEQSFMKDELMRDIRKEYRFSYINSELRKHIEGIEKGAKALDEHRRKNIEYDNVLSELEKSKMHKAEMSKKLDQAYVLLDETKQELIENIYGWSKENHELKMQDANLQVVSRYINNFKSESSYDGVIGIVRQEYNGYEGILNKNKAGLIIKQDDINEQIKELENEINEWKNKKEPEPSREDKVINNRKRLGANNIPYVPLYRAVDFQPETDEETKGAVEKALIDMGIIDALIVPAAYKDRIFEMDKQMADKYLSASPKFLSFDLSCFLRPENLEIPGITKEDIDNVLKSIFLDESSGSTYMDETGRYGIGILKGRAGGGYVPIFIGSSARKRYKEQMIAELSLKCEELKKESDGVSNNIDIINKRLTVLLKEFEDFPKGQDLTVAVNEVKDALFNLEKAAAEAANNEERERKYYEELKILQQRVYELTSKIGIKASAEAYEDAIEDARDYRDILYELEKAHSNLIHISESIRVVNISIEEVENDMDNIYYDINVTDRKLKECIALHDSCIEQLKLSNYEEIKNEIDSCIRMMNEIPAKIEHEITERERQKALYNTITDKLSLMSDRIVLLNELLEIYKEAFIQECGLGYVVRLKPDGDLLKAAKDIIKEINIDDKLQKDESLGKMIEKFQENSQYLREYIVKIDSIFENTAQSEKAEVAEALSSGRRYNITAKVRGRDVDFYKLLDFINEGIDENEKLLKESDRQLFEDILVKNISKKIRAKIYHSQQWVSKMNDLMESMNTSSGLAFSLSWSSKKAETEDQLDTKELVDLLKQEGGLMKGSDLNKLSEHFRSKIAEARRIQEDTGKMQTFHTIMREILDYRKWFEFKLYYTKAGQNKKELTNNAFFQFSGGEKAMAMYVPLFSAVYARYKGARSDCPRIISLDEAFAGVDEQNIRDMFRLLGELKLDFMINSQVIWGDYDTVPSLSICELIRPGNADFVTVIRYKWNGRVKELVG